MVEHLRGQLAIIKPSEMNMIAEMGHYDLEHKTEIQGYKLEISEKEMRAKQFQHEARVMAEATKTMEDAASGLQRQSKDEQRQLKEANFALAEANRILKRENLLRASAIDGRERIALEEKCQEVEENQQIAEKKLLEARSENVRMKDESRDGRGLPTTGFSEESQSRLKEDLKHEESEADRLRKELIHFLVNFCLKKICVCDCNIFVQAALLRTKIRLSIISRLTPNSRAPAPLGVWGVCHAYVGLGGAYIEQS